MKDTTQSRETTPKDAEQPTPMEKVVADMNRRYYVSQTRETIVSERKAATNGRGVFIPRHWLDILDGDAAAYLAHFTHYEGRQSRADGFVSDSNDDIREKLGKRFTNHVQGRVRRDLKRLGLAEFRPGWARVTMVRPNMTLLKAWKEHGDYDEAMYALLEGRYGDTETAPLGDTETVPQSNGKRSTVTRKACDGDTESAPLNTETPVTPETLSQGARARPEPMRDERRGEEEKNRGKMERCVEVLGDIEGTGDSRMLARLVETLAGKYPKVPLLDACKSYRDKTAGMAAQGKPIHNHQAYLEGHFEREAARIASEPAHAFGADAPVFKASDQEVHPRPKIDFREMQRLMAQGVPDAEAVALATTYSEEVA